MHGIFLLSLASFTGVHYFYRLRLRRVPTASPASAYSSRNDLVFKRKIFIVSPENAQSNIAGDLAGVALSGEIPKGPGG